MSKLSFEKLSSRNISEADLLRRLMIKRDNLVDTDQDLFKKILNKELKSYYPILDYKIIKYNDDSIGLMGQYNSFLFKNDLWLGWAGILKEFELENNALYANTLKLWEISVKKTYPSIDHLRAYVSKSKEKLDVKILKDQGFIQEESLYKKNGVEDIIILSKCIKGEYRPWKRKPIW